LDPIEKLPPSIQAMAAGLSEVLAGAQAGARAGRAGVIKALRMFLRRRKNRSPPRGSGAIGPKVKAMAA